MRQPITKVLILICGLGVTNCAATPIPTSRTIDNTMRTDKASKISGNCSEWERTYELLSDEGKQTLGLHNIAVNANDKKSDTGYFVLSPALVSNCDLRVEIGRFLYVVMGGSDNEDDRKFALEHSNEIVQVMRSVWPSGQLSDEKDALLVNRGIRDKDIAPFISELLAKRGLDSGMAYTLITRPIATLESSILKTLKQAEHADDLPQQIFSLVALQQAAPKRPYLEKLKAIALERNLAARTRSALKAIIQKFEVGKKVTFDEIESLDLPLQDEGA